MPNVFHFSNQSFSEIDTSTNYSALPLSFTGNCPTCTSLAKRQWSQGCETASIAGDTYQLLMPANESVYVFITL